MRFSRASFVPCVYSVRSGAVCCGASEAFFFGLDAQMRSEFPLPHAAAVCLLTELPERENSTLPPSLLPTFQMSKNKNEKISQHTTHGQHCTAQPIDAARAAANNAQTQR